MVKCNICEMEIEKSWVVNFNKHDYHILCFGMNYKVLMDLKAKGVN